jgi:S1-C subfamily serine protease
MAGSKNALAALSDHAAQLVERIGGSIVAVHGGGHWSASGIHWRSGVIATAEEALDCDEDIKLTLPGGHEVEASLVGRDPTTDVAVLRFQGDGLPVAPTADAPVRAGQVALAIGSREGAPLAALGVVAFAGGPWHSRRGGTIDSLIALDLAVHRAAEGGAVVDAQGHMIGMAVLGPRRRALAIPASTINRSVDQLLAKGHVFRGYLGAGLLPVRSERIANEPQSPSTGVLVVSLDPNGPAARAGLLVGDIIVAWNAEKVDRVRDIVRLLGAESAGKNVNLSLIRGGNSILLNVALGERPIT